MFEIIYKKENKNSVLVAIYCSHDNKQILQPGNPKNVCLFFFF